ncbi:MAG TPA: non-homologous end-joining DNA ligase [Aggregatilineales bacterium]|nr:non-homologous end-joining DNA ligase [Aggregatilineales bacterium]HPV07144.1 non-homologous end-joining DNA ligase [Aggregatilineales bacterium]HQA67540.1 non-homologous end-joining DNA ligase [Aggregatilineales bacterium]
MKINGHEVEVGNLDQVYFPDAGITKGDLIDYYRRIAPVMLPHLQGRPISMQRYPRGIEEYGFYQKEVSEHFPEWIDRADVYVKEDDATQPQVVVNNAATLVYLADQGVITLHTWLSRADALDRPDRLIFDLDPPVGDFETVRFAARVLRDVLGSLGLVPFVMTTGSKGLHVTVPIDREQDFDAVRAFARDLAEWLASRHPDRFTTEIRKNKREGRLFLDYLRNAYGSHSVAPYSVRALPGAPIATPLDWHELDDGRLHSQTYHLGNIFRRLGQKSDPWQGIDEHTRPLSEARKRLDEQL